MQYLFSHTRAYIFNRREGRGIMFSYNPLVFLPFGRFPVSANVASNCMRCFWVSSASGFFQEGLIGEIRIQGDEETFLVGHAPVLHLVGGKEREYVYGV